MVTAKFVFSHKLDYSTMSEHEEFVEDLNDVEYLKDVEPLYYLNYRVHRGKRYVVRVGKNP